MLAMDTIINGLNVTGVMLMVFGVGGMVCWPIISGLKSAPVLNSDSACDPVGSSRTIRNNPDNPGESIVSKQNHLITNIVMIGIFAVVAVLGFIKLFAG